MLIPNEHLPFKLDGEPVRKEHSFPAAYSLTHLETGDVYIGSTQDLYTRVNKHRTSLAAGVHRNHRVQAAHDTCPGFKVDYIPVASREEGYDIEQTLLDGLRLDDSVLNLAQDARTTRGRPIQESARQRLRDATNRHFSNPEARQVQAEITRRQWADPEYRAKNSGNSRSEESCRNVSAGLKERWKDEEFRKRMSAARGKPVVYEGVEYPSTVAASAATGIPYSTLNSRLKRK